MPVFGHRPWLAVEIVRAAPSRRFRIWHPVSQSRSAARSAEGRRAGGGVAVDEAHHSQQQPVCCSRRFTPPRVQVREARPCVARRAPHRRTSSTTRKLRRDDVRLARGSPRNPTPRPPERKQKLHYHSTWAVSAPTASPPAKAPQHREERDGATLNPVTECRRVRDQRARRHVAILTARRRRLSALAARGARRRARLRLQRGRAGAATARALPNSRRRTTVALDLADDLRSCGVYARHSYSRDQLVGEKILGVPAQRRRPTQSTNCAAARSARSGRTTRSMTDRERFAAHLYGTWASPPRRHASTRRGRAPRATSWRRRRLAHGRRVSPQRPTSRSVQLQGFCDPQLLRRRRRFWALDLKVRASLAEMVPSHDLAAVGW